MKLTTFHEKIDFVNRLYVCIETMKKILSEVMDKTIKRIKLKIKLNSQCITWYHWLYIHSNNRISCIVLQRNYNSFESSRECNTIIVWEVKGVFPPLPCHYEGQIIVLPPPLKMSLTNLYQIALEETENFH